MADSTHPPATREIAQQRRDLAPEVQAAFESLGQKVFADSAPPPRDRSRSSRSPWST